MPHNRYFIPAALDQGGTLSVDDAEFHHMTRVMRQEEGDEVELINGQGFLARATIEEIRKKEALLTIQECFQETKKNGSFTLALALLRPSHLEVAVEKVVELGVDNILLFPAKRSEKKELSDSQKNRLQQIIISATKQCGRLFMPELTYTTFTHCLETQAINCFGDLGDQAISVREVLLKGKNLQMMIGPEAGFTGDEIDLMRKKGAVGITLNRNILRAETAAIAAAACFIGGRDESS
jgi:16S rRNA (uracil1498-N3)-methyltransferase